MINSAPAHRCELYESTASLQLNFPMTVGHLGTDTAALLRLRLCRSGSFMVLPRSSFASGRLPDPFQDHIRDLRLAANGAGVPDEFPVFRGWVAPGGLAADEPVAHL